MLMLECGLEIKSYQYLTGNEDEWNGYTLIYWMINVSIKYQGSYVFVFSKNTIWLWQRISANQMRLTVLNMLFLNIN